MGWEFLPVNITQSIVRLFSILQLEKNYNNDKYVVNNTINNTMKDTIAISKII